MKLTIDGTTYEVTDAIQKATLGDLYVLKAKHAVSVKTIRDTFQRMQGSTDQLDFLDDADVFKSLIGIIWLCRRKAGEDTSMEACEQVPMSDLLITQEDEEQEEAPKALPAPDSVPDAGPAPAQG